LVYRKEMPTRFYFLLVSTTLLIVALLLPTVSLSVKTYDYVFMVDITKSMNVMDYQDEQGNSMSRLEFVKQSMLSSARSLPCGSRIGLAVFTERMPALLYSPIEVCTDYPVLEASINKLDWRMAWVADSNIVQALYNTLQLMQQEMLLKSKLVFFTDGQEAPPINPRYTPDLSDVYSDDPEPLSQGVIVGVGQTSLSRIPKFDEDGVQIGFYEADDVPHASRFGLPADPSKIEGYVPRNGPWGTAKVVGTEHLSSVKSDYLKELAKNAYMSFHHLQSGKGLLDALTAKQFVQTKTVPTMINHWIALASLVFLSLCFLVIPKFRAPTNG
jgi:mxaL protein